MITSLVYINGHPHLRLGPGYYRIEARVDRQHRFKERERVHVGADGLLYPIATGAVDDTRAVALGDPWEEEFMRGVKPL